MRNVDRLSIEGIEELIDTCNKNIKTYEKEQFNIGQSWTSRQKEAHINNLKKYIEEEKEFLEFLNKELSRRGCFKFGR